MPSFNSKMVQLKGNATPTVLTGFTGFNSKMVQLKEEKHRLGQTLAS